MQCLGGAWVWDDGPAVRIASHDVHPFTRVEKHFVVGETESILALFTNLPPAL